MENEIAIQGERAVASVDAIVRQREKMIEIQSRVMQKGVDYGLVPGCPKPSLFKPGAEKLCATFMIAVNPTVEDLSTPDERKYRVSVNLTHQSTGVFLGAGIGEASTSEKKYKWRKAVCAAEFEAADPDRRKIEYKANGETIQQVRTEPADLANTVLKMAKKRAQIDAVLTVLGASDLFTQDIEDIPAEYLNQAKSSEAKPVKKSSAETPTGKQKAIGFVSEYYAPKGKGPHAIKIDGVEGYLKTFDADMGKRLAELKGQKIEAVYEIVSKGGYVNNIISEISTFADANEDTAIEPIVDDVTDDGFPFKN